MKLPLKKVRSAALAGLCLVSTSLFAATGEVTRSGSTYTGKVDGVTKYTGPRYFDAINACINNMSSGTVNIKNSGDSGPGTGSVYAAVMKSNITLNYNNCTVNCNGDAYIVPVLCDNRSNVRVDNMKVTGNPRYAVWFRTNSGVTLSGINFTQTSGLGIRIDDSKGGWTTNVNVNSPTVNGATSQAVETYGVDGFTAGTVTANNSAGCGLLLNKTKNSTVGTVNAYNCCFGGGYAGYRVANSAGPNNRVNGAVNSDHCGRGFFSVTNSNGTTIAQLNAKFCSGAGALIENAWNTTINGGTVNDNGGEGIRFAQNSHDNWLNWMRIGPGNGRGVYETSPGNYNHIHNCDCRGNDSNNLVKSGPNTTTTGSQW
jgi:hypothetical protein